MRYLLLPLGLSLVFWLASIYVFKAPEQRLLKQASQVVAVVLAAVFTAILVLEGLLNAN